MKKEKIKKVLMCEPTYFNVQYEINPWMSSQINNVDVDLAKVQWNKLKDAISQVAHVDVLPGVPNLPDLVFTANAGFIRNRVAILSRFSKPERTPEEVYYKEWFLNNGYDVYHPNHPYEGEGDHLFDYIGRHWIGTGFRTDPRVLREIEMVVHRPVKQLELVDPRWYHLDTAFLPLTQNRVMYYPGAFSEASVEKIRSTFKLSIEISEEDAIMFSCNAVLLKKTIFIPKNVSATKRLEKMGFEVHEFDLSEFIKAGGAAKCLVLNRVYK